MKAPCASRQEKKQEKRYEKPEVRSEEVFETLALTCTKAVVRCDEEPGVPVVKS